MSISLGANGGSYNYPQENDPAGWGDDATNWASAVSAALSNIGLGGTASADAVVNIISTTKGILIPRMTTTQRNAIGSPSTSLLIYNTTTTQYELYTGSTWQSLASYISGTLTVTGAASLQSTLNVTGASTFANVTINGNETVNGVLSVTGNTTLASVTGTNATFTGNTTFGDATSDTTAVTGILNVDSGVLYVDPTNNRVGINVTGPSQALQVSGNVQVSSQILAASGTSGTPSISFSGDTNSGFYSISDNVIGVATNGTRVGEIGVGYGGFTGNIIQVVQGFSATRYSITSNTNWAQASDGITITPKYLNSRIFFSFAFSGQYNTSPGYPSLSVARKIGSGAISYNLRNSTYGLVAPGNNNVFWNLYTVNYIDTLSLGSIDTVTYYLCCKLTASGGAFSVSSFTTGEDNVLMLMEIQS